MSFLAKVFVLVGIALRASASSLNWPDSYRVDGVLRLPYAEIAEPFTAFFDGKNHRSRIDYYGDTVKTYQLSSTKGSVYGQNFKIAPMTTETVLNQRTCFVDNGSKEAPVSEQTVLPDVTDFQMLDYEIFHGKNCSTWQNIVVINQKRNVYTIWVSVEDGLPIRYEMFGYDSLLGSHFDKYYVDYEDWIVNQTIPDEVFAIPAGMSCGDFPGPGDAHVALTMNPMQQYIHHDDTAYITSFNEFKKTHNKSYRHEKEHARRFHTYRHNVRYVHAKNRENLGFQLAINHLADWDDREMRGLTGYRHSKTYNGGQAFPYSGYDLLDLPESLDWRLHGAVSQVKDQAMCGSCWSFGTAGAVEGALFMKTGSLVRLSQQVLMDCSWGEGNNACDGGEDFRAYQWIMKHGLPTEESYGPYLAQDSNCHYQNSTVAAKMTGYVNVTSGDQKALKLALAKQGPISIGIDASHKSMVFYSHGVYYEPDCGSGEDALDHAVLLVGYGTMDGKDYWLVKNSWSTYWGSTGYILMAQKDNNCGVATAATYVLM